MKRLWLILTLVGFGGAVCADGGRSGGVVPSGAAAGQAVSPASIDVNRSSAFVGPVDAAVSVDWTSTPGTDGLMIGVHSELTTTHTAGGDGHSISIFGDAYSTGANDAQLLIGVEGRATVQASTQSASRSYGIVGRGIYDKAGAVNGVAAGAYFSGEIYAGDGSTPNSTGTVVAVYLPANIGGASGQNYSILQADSNALLSVAGIVNFQNFIILPASTGGVGCAAGLAGWFYRDSNGSNELCYCDGSSWQGISSGTDANCS